MLHAARHRPLGRPSAAKALVHVLVSGRGRAPSSAHASATSAPTSGADEMQPSSSSPVLGGPSQPPRFYLPTPLRGAAAGALLRLGREESRHAVRTLRMRAGDMLELCDGRGAVALAELAAGEGGRDQEALVCLLEAPQQEPLAGWQWEVAVACGSLKGGRADWVVEKCAELGAASFLPLLTERSPTISGSSSSSGGEGSSGTSSSSSPPQGGGKRGRRRASTGGGSAGAGEPTQEEDSADWGSDNGSGGSGREGRWQRVATAAMKQCLRAHAMRVGAPATLAQLCQRVAAADVALVGVAGAPPLRDVLAAPTAAAAGELEGIGQHAQRAKHGLLVVGPEGDFTPAELQQLLAAGARPVGLGPLRLRAETAAVALLSYARLYCL